MTEKLYQVLFYGEILPKANMESVKNNLATVFNVDRKKIDALFSGGKKIVKKDASRDVCEKTKAVFAAAGAVVSVVPQGTPAAPPPVPDDIKPPVSATDSAPAPAPAPGIVSRGETAGSVNKAVLLLLTFFLGAFGIHKFYLARYFQGFVYLLFSWTLIPFLVSLIEFLVYAGTGETELNRKYTTGSTPLLIIMAVCGPFVFLAALFIFMAIALPLLIVTSQGQAVLPIIKMVAGNSAAVRSPGNMTLAPRQAAARAINRKTIPHPEGNGLSEAVGNVSGVINGHVFSIDHVFIHNGILHFEQGTGFLSDQEMVIFMFLEDENISNHRIHISADDDSFNHPHIHLKWKPGDADGTRTRVAMKEYDLELTFGQVNGKTVPGKINLNIPGDRPTRLTGTFIAEVTDA